MPISDDAVKEPFLLSLVLILQLVLTQRRSRAENLGSHFQQTHLSFNIVPGRAAGITACLSSGYSSNSCQSTQKRKRAPVTCASLDDATPGNDALRGIESRHLSIGGWAKCERWFRRCNGRSLHLTYSTRESTLLVQQKMGTLVLGTYSIPV